MPKFTIICEDEDVITTKEFSCDYLNEVVEHTQDFLKGVGYCFEDLEVSVFPKESSNVEEMLDGALHN